VPEGYTFTSVSAGEEGTCGITTDQSVVCWEDRNDAGGYDLVADTPITGAWSAVAVGNYAACGLHTDGTVECWGAVEGTATENWPGGAR